MCGMMGMMNSPMTTGMMFMMIIGPILILALIGITVYLVARRLIRKNKVIDQPLMILRERFAKGDITEEEYEQKRKVLDRG